MPVELAAARSRGSRTNLRLASREPAVEVRQMAMPTAACSNDRARSAARFRAAPPWRRAAPPPPACGRRGCCARSRARRRAARSSSSRSSTPSAPRAPRRRAGCPRRARGSWRTPFSRVVEVSSQNGEKPQSSVVPSCSSGNVLGGLEDAVAHLLGRLDAAGRSARPRRRRRAGRASGTAGSSSACARGPVRRRARRRSSARSSSNRLGSSCA